MKPTTDAGTHRVVEKGAERTYGNYEIGDPIRHENLTIFPVSSKTPKNDDRFITLDEGLAAGTVKIIEVGAEESGDAEADPIDPAASVNQQPPSQEGDQAPDSEAALSQTQIEVQEADAEDPFGPGTGEQVAPDEIEENGEYSDDIFGPADVDGDVNTLMVLNTSGKPLYLMPGEVISGGNQDRTIGQELVIDSSEKPVPIEVFCVEHGRWADRGIEATTAQLASTASYGANLSLVVSRTASVEELAKEAQTGKFIASVGQLNKDTRLAVQHSGAQDKVWDEVAKSNSKIGNESESGNFAATYFSSEITEDLEPYIEKLKPVSEAKQIVGVAVAVNGKMLSVDVFESTPLFKKFWPKLLKSFALDAVAAKIEKGTEGTQTAVTIEDCVAFMKDVETSKAEMDEVADDHKVVTRESPIGLSFSYYDAQAASAIRPASEGAGGGLGGGYGGSVHTSVLAK
jgi:hypothetical protein